MVPHWTQLMQSWGQTLLIPFLPSAFGVSQRESA